MSPQTSLHTVFSRLADPRTNRQKKHLLLDIVILSILAEAGAVVLPASPSFYSRPSTLDAACMTVVERILSRLGIAHGGYEWGV